MLTILSSIVNIIVGGGGDKELIWLLNEHMNLHFDNVWNIHMSSKNYQANGYMHNLDLLIISH